MVLHPGNRGGPGSRFAAGALLLVPPLCCGLLLLISPGVLAGGAAALTKPGVIGVAGAVLAVALWRLVARRTGPTSDSRRAETRPGQQPGSNAPNPVHTTFDPHPGLGPTVADIGSALTAGRFDHA